MKGTVPVLKGSVASRLLGGSAAGSLGFALSVLQAVLQVPLLLQVWPAETFILWVGVQGLFGLITSVDVGFHAFVGAEANMIGVAKSGDVQRLLSSAMRFTTASAALQLAACVAVSVIGCTWAGAGRSMSYLKDIGPPLVALAAYWLIVGSQNGLLCRLYLAYGETVRYQLFGVAQKALLFIATVATAWCGGGVLKVAIAYAFAAGAVAACNVIDLKWRRAAVMPRWETGCWSQGFAIFRRSLGISLSMFLDQITNGGVAAYVSAAIPSATAAQFSTIRSLTNAISQASGVVMFPTVPELGRDATPSRIARAALLIDALMLVCVTPLAVAMTFAAPWIPDLYATWTRKVLSFDAVVFVALAAAVLIRQVGMPFTLFLSATNEVGSQFKATCLRAAVLAAGVACLAAVGGAAGIAAALALAEAVVLGFAYLATSFCFQQYNGCLGRLQAALALAHVCTSVVVMFTAYRFVESSSGAYAAGVAVHAVIAITQVRAVPEGLREKLAMLLGGRGKAAGG
jgi:O-antigen/teichoic acid export membrane protein